MQEVRFWLADDGTKFDDAWDCEQYEMQIALKECEGDFVLYDYYKTLIPIKEATPEKVCYILIKTHRGANCVKNWFESNDCNSPFGYCEIGNEIGLWFYGETEDYNCEGFDWYKVETEIERLQQLKSKFVIE